MKRGTYVVLASLASLFMTQAMAQTAKPETPPYPSMPTECIPVLKYKAWEEYAAAENGKNNGASRFTGGFLGGTLALPILTPFGAIAGALVGTGAAEIGNRISARHERNDSQDLSTLATLIEEAQATVSSDGAQADFEAGPEMKRIFNDLKAQIPMPKLRDLLLEGNQTMDPQSQDARPGFLCQGNPLDIITRDDLIHVLLGRYYGDPKNFPESGE